MTSHEDTGGGGNRNPPRPEFESTPPALGEVKKRVHGDTRRTWTDQFLRYAYAIAEHPNYAGMPCATDEEGKLDWTIPTNRKPGSKNWDGNARRRKWWADKARELDLPAEGGSWISAAAKRNHPWHWKPCQPCGRWMRLSYCYPTGRTLRRLNSAVPASSRIEADDLLDIYEVTDKLADELGLERAAQVIGQTFPECADLSVTSVEELKTSIEKLLVKNEPRGRLSPGAMSNAPDRLDGFHTYNLCCRGAQDTGRGRENMRAYGVDRRAFENWTEGDWEAANALMNSVGKGQCPICGSRAQLSPDHVGPISLGFRHAPFFEAICGPCNSAKNNRMTLRDIERLRERQSNGEDVACWHSSSIWSRASARVDDDAGALRLSRLMSVNQHEYLAMLARLREAHLEDALLQFLSPEYALDRIEFIDLDAATLTFSSIKRSKRQDTYATTKATRLIRVAFESLDAYSAKANRNVRLIPEENLDLAAHEGLTAAIADAAESPSPWRDRLIAALDPATPFQAKEAMLTAMIEEGLLADPPSFPKITKACTAYMDSVGAALADRLDDDQAIRDWAEVLEDEADG